MFSGLVFLWLWEFRIRNARKKRMRALADRLGFTYSEETLIPAELVKYPLFAEFGRVYRKLSNLIQGEGGGLQISIFDYRHPDYLRQNSRGVNWTYIETCILIKDGARSPEFFSFEKGLEPEEIENKLSAILEKHRN